MFFFFHTFRDIWMQVTYCLQTMTIYTLHRRFLKCTTHPVVAAALAIATLTPIPTTTRTITVAFWAWTITLTIIYCSLPRLLVSTILMKSIKVLSYNVCCKNTSKQRPLGIPPTIAWRNLIPYSVGLVQRVAHWQHCRVSMSCKALNTIAHVSREREREKSIAGDFNPFCTQ